MENEPIRQDNPAICRQQTDIPETCIVFDRFEVALFSLAMVDVAADSGEALPAPRRLKETNRK